MRGSPLVVLAACAAGCFFQPMEAPQADTTASTTNPATTTTSPTTEPQVCLPGMVIPCICKAELGEQTCTPDGQGFDECQCPEDPTTTTVPTQTTTTADPDTSSSTGTTTTTDTTAALDTTTTTTGDTTTTGADTSTGDSSTGSSSTTGAPMCMDDKEPENDTYEGAAQQTELNCFGGKTFTDTLDGANDVDWHTFEGNSAAACDNTPRLQVGQTSDEQIRLCVFLVCLQGSPPEFECLLGEPMDAMIATGCCGTGDIDVYYDCPGANEDVLAFVSLDEGPANTCVDYKIDYTFVID